MRKVKENHRLLVLSCALVLLGGCALTEPFITEDDWEEAEKEIGMIQTDAQTDVSWEKTTKQVCVVKRNFDACMNQAEKLRAVYNQKSIDISDDSGTFRAAAIGVGVVGTALGYYSDSGTAIAGMGILGTASYAFSKLTPWEKYLKIYQTGQEMLAAATQKASKAAKVMREIECKRRKERGEGEDYGCSQINAKTTRQEQIEKNLEVLKKFLEPENHDHYDEILDVYRTQVVEFSKDEAQFESDRKIAKEIEELAASMLPSGDETRLAFAKRASEAAEQAAASMPGVGVREKVSIWLGMELLRIRYATDSNLSQANLWTTSETPAESSGEIRKNVQDFIDVHSPPKATPDASQPQAPN